MKSNYISLLIIIAFVFLTYNHVFGQKINPDLKNIPLKNKIETVYKTENVVNFRHVKTALDSKGNLYAVFYDPYNDKAFFAENKSGEWKTEELITKDENDGCSAQYPAIAIDKNDNIHVAFTRYKDKLVYGKKKVSDSKWTFTEINNDNTPELIKFYVYQKYIDMCTDDNGGIHIIISGEGRDLQEKIFDMSAIYFYKPANEKWKNELIKRGIVDTYTGFGTDPSIVCRKNSVFATFGGKNSINFVQKTIGNNKWDIEQIFVDDEMNGGKEETSLSLTPDGTPIFAYVDLFDGQNYQGLNIATKSVCCGGWYVDNRLSENLMRSPAIGVDNDGVIYLAYEHNPKGITLAYRSCTCEQSWKNVFNDNQVFTSFIDMIIDDKNHVHVLYGSETKIKHAEFWFERDIKKDCNLLPFFTNKPKTNVKTGETIEISLKAFDYECDEIQFYFVAQPESFTLTNNGNGTATLKGKIFDTEGQFPVSVFVSDKYHKQGSKPVCGMTIMFNATKDGLKKGSFKISYDEGNLTDKVIENLTKTIKLQK